MLDSASPSLVSLSVSLRIGYYDKPRVPLDTRTSSPLLGVVGSAAVVPFLRSDVLFGWYAIGLVIGLFGYFTIGLRFFGKQEMQAWRIPPIPSTSVPVNAHGEEES